jgi:FixJ family two-component response regulator
VSEEFIIAVIDDDESFRIALVGLLCVLGYEAQEFVSAVEFINRGGGYAPLSFDLVDRCSESKVRNILSIA